MKTVANKTQRPLTIPLPRGKTLHLGPGKTGQISTEAAGHQPLKKLVDAGQIEVYDDAAAPTSGTAGDRKARPSFYGHPASSGGRRSGDR